MRIKQREQHVSLKTETYPSILNRIFSARGITDEEALDKRLTALISFAELKDIQKACERLARAIRHDETILVIGDFDADGATSTALAVSALKTLGAKQVHFLVPNRFEFGYGLTPAIVDVAKARKPHLIVTVDNGIASIEGVARANELGIDVVVTDHHLPGDISPEAYAIVNPNQHGCPFPSKSIAGVGVIFYVMLALRRHLVDTGWFDEANIEAPNMAQFLDLVALGTVADVVGLDKNNRILVSQGVARIQQGKTRPGILALIKVAGREVSRLRESDLGFSIAPRLNAAGRLDDMSLGITCLLSESFEIALNLAERLDELNQERRLIETEMKGQAMTVLNTLAEKVGSSHSLPIALCLTDESWHQGVIGILAGRLKERFHRPVIIFAAVGEGELKGSARSVNGVNIRDILADIDVSKPGLITKFGGHAMAAGLSIQADNFKTFREAFVNEVSKHLKPSDCEGVILSDGPLTKEELSMPVAKLIQQAGPWGQHFPEPVFDNTFEIIEQRLVGKNHLKLTLSFPDDPQFIDAIAFNVDTNIWPNHRAKHVHIAYKLDINVYQNREKLQLIVESLV